MPPLPTCALAVDAAAGRPAVRVRCSHHHAAVHPFLLLSLSVLIDFTPSSLLPCPFDACLCMRRCMRSGVIRTMCRPSRRIIQNGVVVSMLLLVLFLGLLPLPPPPPSSRQHYHHTHPPPAWPLCSRSSSLRIVSLLCGCLITTFACFRWCVVPLCRLPSLSVCVCGCGCGWVASLFPLLRPVSVSRGGVLATGRLGGARGAPE